MHTAMTQANGNRIYISPVTLKLIRRALFKAKKELGGALVYDSAVGQLRATKLRWGKYDSVQLPRGRIDFHTHPVVCKSNSKCALEVPSAFDIVYLYENQAFERNRYHFVFTRMGTYRIRLQGRSRQAALESSARDPRFRITLRKNLLTLFGGMYEKFNREYPRPGLTLSKFRSKWLRAMREVGFHVKLFLHPQIPYLPKAAKSTFSSG